MTTKNLTTATHPHYLAVGKVFTLRFAKTGYIFEGCKIIATTANEIVFTVPNLEVIVGDGVVTTGFQIATRNTFPSSASIWTMQGANGAQTIDFLI